MTCANSSAVYCVKGFKSVTEAANIKNTNETQAVSIAGGSLFVIGLMLWFFTSGTKNEFKALRSELSEVKESLEKQSEALKQLSAGINTNGTSDHENIEK